MLKLLHPIHGPIFRVVKIIGQHLAVDGILVEPFGQSFPSLFPLDVGRRRLVAGNNGAFPGQICSLKHIVDLTGLIDTGADQHGIAPAIHEAGLGVHIKEDVIDDLLQARLAGEHLLHGAPFLLELTLGKL